MLGRIAESASLGHSFRHNALMKWCLLKRKKTKQQKAPPKNTHTKRNPEPVSKKTGIAVDWNGRVRGNSVLQTFSNSLIESMLIDEHQTSFVTGISACWGGVVREFASQMPYCSKGKHEYRCSLRVRFL